MSPKPITRRRTILGLLFALALAAPATIHAGDGPGDGPARSAIDIYNFGRVNANDYRGAAPAENDYADLAALGVRTVIGLRTRHSTR